MYYDIISAVLVALGLGLIFFLDNLISKDVSNEYLQAIRKNNMICGLVAIAAGYYVYTLQEQSVSEDNFFARLRRPRSVGSSDMSSVGSMSTNEVLKL
jgi:hypothetical protein